MGRSGACVAGGARGPRTGSPRGTGCTRAFARGLVSHGGARRTVQRHRDHQSRRSPCLRSDGAAMGSRPVRHTAFVRVDPRLAEPAGLLDTAPVLPRLLPDALWLTGRIVAWGATACGPGNHSRGHGDLLSV